MVQGQDLLKINVGFIIHQTIGYLRDMPIEAESVHLPPDLDLKDFTGNVRVTRTAQGLLVQGKFRAFGNAECVRCLKDFDQEMMVDFTELYAFSHHSVTESGLYVPENGKIDLTPLVWEEMIVAMPISPVCRPDCKGLCPVCGENLNETTCHHDEEDVDTGLGPLAALL